MSFKPSGEEQNWAKQQEIDIKRKLREFRYRNKFDEAVNPDSSCPADGKDLERVEIDKTGVYVYRCTMCGGVWINRRDLEKLVHSVGRSNRLTRYLANILNINL